MTAADIPVIDEAKLEAFVGQACSTWVQRLFAAGLTVQSVATGMREDAPAERLERVVSGIDDTIGQIRTSIFHRALTSARSRDGTHPAARRGRRGAPAALLGASAAFQRPGRLGRSWTVARHG